VIPIDGQGPEDIAFDAQGRLLTGVRDGRILRVDPRSGNAEELANTGGRPLGIEPAPGATFVVCDARRGLLRLDPATRTLSTLVEWVHGRPMKLCDNAAVLPDGTICFSDSSLRNDLEHYGADIVAHVGTGRLLRRGPDGSAEVLLSGLQFANGVVAAPDGSFVAVAQSGERAITRLWLRGSPAGRSDSLVTALPGYPDNLSVSPGGTIWVALPRSHSRLLDVIHGAPRTLRRAIAAVSGPLTRLPSRATGVVELTMQGEVLRHLTIPRGRYRSVTGVRQHGRLLYLGSLVERGIGVLDLSADPSEALA
jgi:sugar lactone lactonase YvrE